MITKSCKNLHLYFYFLLLLTYQYFTYAIMSVNNGVIIINHYNDYNNN